MEPRNLCSNLLHKFPIGIFMSEPPHIFQISGRKSLHAGKGASQVLGNLIDDLGPPALSVPAGQEYRCQYASRERQAPD